MLSYLIETPGPVTYCTPHFDMNMDSTIELDETAELDDNFEDLDFSTSDLSTRLKSPHSSADHINDASAEDTKMDSRLLSTDEGGSLGLSGFASNSIDDGRSEVAEGYIWSQGPITSASKLFPAIDIFNSDDLESPQSSITGNQNAAANEHGHGEEHDRLSRNAPLSVPGGFQEEGDVQNQERFVASMIPDDHSPIIGDKYPAANEAPNMAPARLTHEASLSALGEAIDECFKDGFELDLTISQLLSLLTYLQGPSSEPEEQSEGFLSYWEMENLAALASYYIEKQQHAAAVLLYKRVIINAWMVFRDVLFTDFMRVLEEIFPFSHIVKRECYLEHELTVLQLVVAGYFKLLLSAENRLDSVFYVWYNDFGASTTQHLPFSGSILTKSSTPSSKPLRTGFLLVLPWSDSSATSSCSTRWTWPIAIL
jgi:hypothetical protein